MEKMGEGSTKHQLGQQDMDREKACPHRAMRDVRGKKKEKKKSH